MAGDVARLSLAPGRRLRELVIYRGDGPGRHVHPTAPAEGSEAALRSLLRGAGLWTAFRRRPFGGHPPGDERPAAILVRAVDTRPGAPDPARALRGRGDDLARGLAALARLTDGPVFLCHAGPTPPEGAEPTDRLRLDATGRSHPAGEGGFLAHALLPARPDRPVWDVHAEDVAGMGALLATGLVDETRHVSVTGDALGAARTVRCQPGADLRALTWRQASPGPHSLLSGSPLEGRPARWLGPRDRQVTALAARPAEGSPHWLRTALGAASRPVPLIPTAALDRALGGAFPAAALLRAVSVGDAEGAERLGALSLLPEDLALADYVTGAEPRLSDRLAGLLTTMAREAAA
jgi:Na+-transporting NADH:ubiquinone oxidoreductase subunit A